LSTKSGVAAIANEVIGDVQKEAEAIIQAAESEAKETLRAAKEQADQTYRQILAESKEKAEAEKRKITSVTEVDMRNGLLQTKEDLVDEAFDKATAKLKRFVETEEYPTYLLGQIEEIAKKMDQKVHVVEVNAKDRGWLTVDMLKHASKKLHVEFTISDQTENYIGGCKVHSEDGKIVYDGTIDNRLDELKPKLRAEIAKQFFTEEA
jgi:V/A-type H+/Na+-transporting ATPase subunit E